MNYPLRYPLSWLLAKMGIAISINIDFIYDDEAKVFVATSRDIKGLVLEADNFNALTEEVKEAIPNLLNLSYKKTLSKISTDIIFKDHITAI